jgi:glycosyltransferase involved in cell wall biosynthesis
MTHSRPTLISIIVTTYNQPAFLKLVLNALELQTDTNFEIIIADDGSKDETRQLVLNHLSKSGKRICHAWHADKGFRAAAIRNQGIALANGDYLIFLDGDCIPQSDFVAVHRKLAEPGFLLSGSRVMLSKQFSESLTSNAAILPSQNCHLYLLKQRLRGNLNKVLPFLFKHFPLIIRKSFSFNFRRIKSCNLAVWTSDCKKIDGFDASFVGWGHEDADFVVRLFNAGINRKYGTWATEVFHLWHPINSRENEIKNRNASFDSIDKKRIYARNGISHLSQKDRKVIYNFEKCI